MPTPGRATLARKERIDLAQRFSDHTPLTIEYNLKPEHGRGEKHFVAVWPCGVVYRDFEQFFQPAQVFVLALHSLCTQFTPRMNPPLPQPTRRASRWIKWPLTLLALGVVAVLLWRQLPGAAYATDLSRVGAGHATLVLAQDSNYVGGAEVMELMNGIRTDYAGRVEFLVAHLAMADAQAFAERHAARDGTVLLFAGDGRRVGVLHHPRSQDELRRALAEAFGD